MLDAKTIAEMKPGAVDYAECPQGGHGCRCGRCSVCGHPKHMAVHGPCWGEEPGSRPYDHEYVPVEIEQVKS